AAEADAFLDSIGIPLTGTGTKSADQIARDLIAELLTRVTANAQTGLDALVFASGQQNTTEITAYIEDLVSKLIDSFDDAARPVLVSLLEPIMRTAGDVRPALRDQLLAGIPCFNVTFLGSGTFTHATTAGTMDLKGTVSVSTTGAALARGEMRVAGIPMAEASLGVSLTNGNGEIAPFFGGLAKVGFGPLEMGKLTMSASMPAASQMLVLFDDFINDVGSTLNSGAQNHLRLLMENIIGQPMPAGLTVQAFLQSRSDQERLTLVTGLYNFFQNSAEDAYNTATQDYVKKVPAHLQLAGDDFTNLLTRFEQFVADTLNTLTPELCWGGKVAPSLFGIPMTANGEPIASARMRFGAALRQPGPLESPIALLGDPTNNLRPGAPVQLREFSSYMQFSPTALALSSITGLVVATNPANAPFAGFTAVDSAEFGMAFEIDGWTQEKVHEMLFDPLAFVSNRTKDFFESVIFGAGYTMKPFGMELANAEMRLFFPEWETHPKNTALENPNRNWQRPMPSFTGTRPVALPTADEVILAALANNRLRDSTWRGRPGELDDLFPPAGTLPTDGCTAKIADIAAELRAIDPNLTALSALSLEKDYFPYGGILGGGELALPKLLTQGIPPEFFNLLNATDDLFGSGFNSQQAVPWLNAFEATLEFLSSSDCVGQIGFHLPAPNPVLLPGEQPSALGNLSPDQFLKRLETDPLALVGRTLNTDLYPMNEILLRGWANAKFLGLEIGRADITYDFDDRFLAAKANIPPNPTQGNDNNWLNDFLTGDVTLRMSLPANQQSGLTEFSASDLFKQIGDHLPRIRTLQGNALKTEIEQIQASLVSTLPRLSLEAGGAVQIPEQFSNVLRSSTNLDFFAFSPYHDPDFETANFSPYAVARRRGGLGIKGAFDFGFFPPTGDPIVISVPSASLALTPSANVAVLPAISGELQVAEFSIPGAPSFTDGLLQFASSPDNGAPYIAVRGSIEPFLFQLPTPGGPVDLLRAQPLSPATALAASFQVLRSDAAPNGAALDLRLDPVSASIPLLGPNAAISLHGGPNGAGGFQPFSFSTAPGTAWSAQMAISAPNNPSAAPVFSIRDPFNPTGNALLTFTPTGPVTGAVSGQGLDSFNAQFTVPTGFDLVFYPGTANESRVSTPTGKSFVFAFDSTGRFYCDLGSLTNISLPGLIQAGARIEFGFNPTDPQPDVRVTSGGSNITAPVSFGSINLVDSAVRTLVVRNDGTLPANIG
ncbi:MAG: hypothetical protein ACRDBP_14505, partial [Luteolibacter sp.]